MMQARSGVAVVAVLIAIVLVSIISTQFGLMMLANNGDPGHAPAITQQPNEKVIHVSRMEISRADYSLWDVRDNRTGFLKLMVLVNPSDGKPVRDPDIEARAFSLRLILQIAYVVKSVKEGSKGAEDTVSRIAGLATVAIYVAQTAGQYSIVEDLRSLSTFLGEKTRTALSLAATIDGSYDYANRLLNDPNEQNADLFMASFGASAAVTVSQKAAFIYILITNAIQQVGIQPGAWLESLYSQLTHGINPTVILFSATFGTYETSQTSRELLARGAY